MPVSKKLNCIFIHIPKTAGTSIEAALGMHGDIDHIGKRPHLNQVKDLHHFFGDGLQHLTALQLKNHPKLPLAFDSAFKFTFARNPWDRIISALAFDGSIDRALYEKPLEFYENGIRRVYQSFRRGKLWKEPHFRRQIDYILDDNGDILVDFIGRFERLSEDWSYARKRIGFAAELEKRMRSNHFDYKKIHTQETREIVSEIYRDDIHFFDYRFPT